MDEAGTSKPRRKRRAKGAPTHVVEFPLIVTESDRHVLEKRFRAAGILRNALVEEVLRRLDAMRAGEGYALARAIPKGDDHREARKVAFGDQRKAFGFGQESLAAYARSIRDAFWIKDHLGGHDTQTIAADVFRGAERHAYGMAGRPRFKRVSDLRSIASKDPKSIMRLKGRPEDGPENIRFEFRGLSLRIRRRTFSPSELHSLSMPALSFRVVRHRDTARERFAVQIVVDGPARMHRVRREGRIAIDVGPSTVAAIAGGADGVSDVVVETFCPDVIQPWAEIRRLQRRVDRSFRAANPDCFRTDGTFIEGKKAKGRSKALTRRRRQLRRKEAKLAARRAKAHGRLSNRLLGAGTTVHAEQLSHRAFQRAFGRSVKVRAPGAFFATLTRKAKAAGGEVIAIPAWKAKLSQLDHTSGDYVRKPLSLRRHAMRDGSGVVVDRDAYSAFLALHTDSTGTVDVAGCARDWTTGACERLAAASKDAEPTSGQGFPLPPATGSRPSRRSRSQRRPQHVPSGTARKSRRGSKARVRSGSRGQKALRNRKTVGSPASLRESG